MMEKLNKKIILSILIILGFILSGYLVWNSYPIQDLIGRFKMETDSKIEEHLKQELQNKSDKELVRLLRGGDYGKAQIAKYFLAQRANPKLFDDVVELLKNKNKEVRIRARALLWSLDQERALKVYISELENLNKNSYEYEQVLNILSFRKYQPVFPYLVEYAEREDGWKNASAKYFKELGNPEAIPVLKEMLNKVDPKSFWAKSSKNEILDTIAFLEAKKKESNPQIMN